MEDLSSATSEANREENWTHDTWKIIVEHIGEGAPPPGGEGGEAPSSGSVGCGGPVSALTSHWFLEFNSSR